MNEKQKIIEAIKSLDFIALEDLLDENRSYMDVTKGLFLSTLKKKVAVFNNLNNFNEVIEGNCCYCNNGRKGYKFIAYDIAYLDLFIEEINNKVTDIYLCNALVTETPSNNEFKIYFKFYDDQKVKFKPTIDFLNLVHRIENAIEEFNKLELFGLIPVNQILNWFNKMAAIENDIKYNYKSKHKDYKAFQNYKSIYFEVSCLVHNYEKNQIAKEALKEYYNIDMEDERMIISWLLKHKENYFFSLKKTLNWEKTGVLILETQPNLVVDCIEFLDSFIFSDIYSQLEFELMEKYKPSYEDFSKYEHGNNCSLIDYLKIQNKYLELM